MGGCSPLNGSKSRYPRPSKALIRGGDSPVWPCPAVRPVRLVSRAAGAENVAVVHSEADPEGMSLSRLLAVAGHIVGIRWQRFMGGYGLTPHGLTVLAYLEHGSGLTQRELARRCGISPSTLNHTVDHLTRSGWVERRRDTTDRRLVRLGLTESGHRHLGQVREAADDQIEPLLSHLAAADEPAVRRFLLETVTRFQEMEEDPVLGRPTAPGNARF
jgi:MarR family transcriptional regulator, organic hydroperoxide resistance regulator